MACERSPLSNTHPQNPIRAPQEERKIETLFGSAKSDMSVYDNFVKQVTDQKRKTTKGSEEETSP